MRIRFKEETSLEVVYDRDENQTITATAGAVFGVEHHGHWGEEVTLQFHDGSIITVESRLFTILQPTYRELLKQLKKLV